MLDQKNKFDNGFNYLLCHMSNSVRVMIYGDVIKASGQIWLGINGLEFEMDRIIKELETTIPEKTS